MNDSGRLIMEGHRDTEFHHSAYYHRFFRGYSEKTVEDGRGHKKLVRAYTEDYIVQKASARQVRMQKVLFLLLYCISAVFYLGASFTIKVRGGEVLPLDLLTAAGVVILVPEAAVVLLYVLRPEKMTIHDYESTGPRLKILSGVSVLIAAGCGAAVLILLLAGYQGSAGDALAGGALLYLLSGMVSGAVYYLERRTAYETVENEAEDFPEGNRIC